MSAQPHNHTIREMAPQEAGAVVEMWHQSWHLAHATFVPSDLIAVRSRDDFAARLAKIQTRIRIAGPIGAPLGLCVIRDNELDQLFVSETAMGTGLAAHLLAEGERRIRANGFDRAVLHCVAANTRACRFYIRQGWVESGHDKARLETAAGHFELDTLLFKKDLRIVDAQVSLTGE